MGRIDINPAICGGKPVIRGTRIMIRNILGYPELQREDVVAALAYRRM